MVDHVTDAWKSSERKAQDVADEARRVTVDAARPQDVSEVDWARAQMIAGSDALAYHQKVVRDNRFWQQEIAPGNTSDNAALALEQRNRELADAWRTTDAAAVATPPSGAYAPVGLGANEGDVCSWNGAPGNLVRRGDWLFCEVHQPGPTRSGTSSGRDAAVGDRSLQDAAWHAMVADLTSAWKPKD